MNETTPFGWKEQVVILLKELAPTYLWISAGSNLPDCNVGYDLPPPNKTIVWESLSPNFVKLEILPTVCLNIPWTVDPF